jgi:hypothetical protein
MAGIFRHERDEGCSQETSDATMAAANISRYHKHPSDRLDSGGIGSSDNDVLSRSWEAKHGPVAIWASPRDSPPAARFGRWAVFPCLKRRPP